MANVRAEKQEVVARIKEEITSAKGVVFADYRGITVAQDTALRKKAREAGVEYRVIKNTLARFAANEAGIEGLDQHFNGPTVMAYSLEDAVMPAKLVSDFIKESKLKTYEIKAGIVDGQAIDAAGVKQLANLPSREVLLSKMLGSMQAPISGFANVLQGTIRKMVYVFEAVRKQKESS